MAQQINHILVCAMTPDFFADFLCSTFSL